MTEHQTDASGPSPATRRRRRTFDELVQAARVEADKAKLRFQQKAARVEKQEAKLAERMRKLDTRRKIIAGAIALEHAKHDPIFRARLDDLLDRFVDPEHDRLLFGLAPRPPEPKR